MTVLRRPDYHHRNVRRRAPCAFTSAEPDQDRHFMIAIATLPASQARSASLPAARRTKPALSSQRPQALFKRRAHATPSYACNRKSSPSSLPPITLGAPTDNTGRLRPPQRYVRSVRDLQIPIGPARPNRAPSSSRFPPYEAFERRPPSSPARLQRAGVRNPSAQRTSTKTADLVLTLHPTGANCSLSTREEQHDDTPLTLRARYCAAKFV